MTRWQHLPTLGLVLAGLVFTGCDSPFGSGDGAASARAQGGGEGDEAKPDGKDEGRGEGKPAIQKVCPEVGTTVLYGGQHHEVGYVDASISEGTLHVKLVGKDWTFTEAHIDVATSPEGLHGSPGQMLHNSGRLDGVSEYSASFDLSALGYESGAPLYIATHAVAHGTREGKDAAETSWGYGTRYGEGWGWYFSLPNALCPGGSGPGSTDTTGDGGSTGTGSGEGSGSGTDVPNNT